MLANVTVYGLLLAVLGIASYFGTGRVSVTALIPLFFGLPVLAAAALARSYISPRSASVFCAVLAVAALGATVKALPQLQGVFQHADGARPAAVIAKSLMALLSFIYLAAAALLWRR